MAGGKTFGLRSDYPPRKWGLLTTAKAPTVGMNPKPPERIAPPAHPLEALTVTDMWRKGWALRAVCHICRQKMDVDLVALIRLNGPQMILWGRTTKCKIHLCAGTMSFEACTLPGAFWQSVSRIDPKGQPFIPDYERRELARVNSRAAPHR